MWCSFEIRHTDTNIELYVSESSLTWKINGETRIYSEKIGYSFDIVKGKYTGEYKRLLQI